MRSERYFRLLDALDALVAAEPTPTVPRARNEARSPSTRPTSAVRKAAEGRPPRRPSIPRTATRRCTEFARAPSGFATPRRHWVRRRCPTGPRASRRCSATIRTAWSAARTVQQAEDRARRGRGHLHLRPAVSAGRTTRPAGRGAARRGAHPAQEGGALRQVTGGGADELACKPDSVPRRAYRRRGGDHPSGHTVAGCLERPTRRLGRAALERLRSRIPGCGLLGLASGGVCLATPVTRNAGALLPHRFTLTTCEGWRSVFCGTFPRVTSDCR